MFREGAPIVLTLLHLLLVKFQGRYIQSDLLLFGASFYSSRRFFELDLFAFKKTRNNKIDGTHVSTECSKKPSCPYRCSDNAFECAEHSSLEYKKFGSQRMLLGNRMYNCRRLTQQEKPENHGNYVQVQKLEKWRKLMKIFENRQKKNLSSRECY